MNYSPFGSKLLNLCKSNNNSWKNNIKQTEQTNRTATESQKWKLHEGDQ